jgi:glycosyltransferase involved in cell wall biosynthesis
MKVLLVFLNDVWNLSTDSLSYAVYAQGFRSLGLDVSAVCLPGRQIGYEDAVTVSNGEDDFRDVEYWRSLHADIAIVVTWLKRGEELSALRAAGLKVVNLSDSDGFATAWSHPDEWLKRMTIYQHSPQMKLRAAVFWLRRYLFPRNDIDAVGLNLRNSDSIILHSDAAVANLRRFSDRFPKEFSAQKFHVVPYPVNDMFCELDPTARFREDRIVAVGRWDDPQKDARLLVRTLERFAKQRDKTRVAIIGRGGDSFFVPLTVQCPQIQYLGTRTQTELRDLYLSSRAILFTSRWETGPIAAGEALASGCTLIGAPLMNFLTYHLAGPFGRCSPDRSAVLLAEAIDTEMQAWDRGERLPNEIAGYWRARLNATTVCRQLLATIDIDTDSLLKIESSRSDRSISASISKTTSG